MSAFLTRLQNEKVLVSDGATGTNLQKVGLVGGIIPEGWVLEQPEKILNLESAFAEAGSDIILTCTFGGTKLRLRESPLGQLVEEINRRAAEIAREAANKRPGTLVAGSMGPTGLLIKPYGPATTEEVANTYEEQTRGLVAGGADLLVIETMFAINEAQAAVEGVRRVTELPIIVSFSYDRGTRSMMGTKPSDVVKTFKPLGVAGIGANCGTTLENMETILKEYMSAAPELVYWIKPNAGLPELGENNEALYRVTPQAMAEYAEKFVAAGARIVGGCCGSTPEHVAAIAKAVKQS